MKQICLYLLSTMLITTTLFGINRNDGETATLVLTARDNVKKVFYAEYTLYDAVTKSKIKFAAGVKMTEIPLKPGKYNLKIYNPKGRLTQWVKNITLKQDQRLVRTVLFVEGTMVVGAKSNAGQNIFALYFLYESGTEDQKYFISGVGEKRLKVNPGTYDLKVKDPKTKRETWEVEIKVGPGEQVKKVVSFAHGTLMISSRNKQKKQIFAEYYVYKHQKKARSHRSAVELIDADSIEEEQVKAVKFASGTGSQRISLPSGRYDIKVRNKRRSQERWIHNIQIKGKQVKAEIVTFQ